MGPSSPHYELIYHDDTFYEGYINSRFILVHKGILVITYDCTRDNEQGLWIELIDKLNGPIWLINQLGPVLG